MDIQKLPPSLPRHIVTGAVTQAKEAFLKEKKDFLRARIGISDGLNGITHIITFTYQRMLDNATITNIRAAEVTGDEDIEKLNMTIDIQAELAKAISPDAPISAQDADEQPDATVAKADEPTLTDAELAELKAQKKAASIAKGKATRAANKARKLAAQQAAISPQE